MPLYTMQYSIRGEWRGDIELNADSEDEAKNKAKAQLADYARVSKNAVTISGIEEIAKKKVAA